ncbi:hypothetical protein NDU88_000540 [Pleurodeles waltl]|uniref:Uncharacterized protein n=1 Tax=Pleurodeles waltl TaxID=8319 RepID=A0AAV7UQ95_PLEWA|nr:hypothetical protein NDU88_000540 [Pleurodeles waltl]
MTSAPPAVGGATASTSPPQKKGEGATQPGGTPDQVLSPRDQLGPHISSEISANIQKGAFVDIFELTTVKPADEESKDIKDCSYKWKKPKVWPFFNLYCSWEQDAVLRLFWIARGGLRLDGLHQLIEEVLRRQLPPPTLIILHVGGSDLPTIERRTLFEDLMAEISWLAKRCPGSIIAWSHIIPRRIWMSGRSTKALNEPARRLNSHMKWLLIIAMLRTVAHGCLRGEAILHEHGIHLSDGGHT